jgi:transposase
VIEWLADNPRWTFHFTPTSASWLNAVENFFSALTRRAIRRGVFRSVADLQRTIRDYINRQNADPKPFVWTKTPTQIFDKISPASGETTV